MAVFGNAVRADTPKARMMYTLASGMFGRLDEYLSLEVRDDNTLSSNSVDLVRACLDAAMGMVWVLNGQGFGDEDGFDLDAVIAAMRGHTESSRLWDDGGVLAGKLVAEVMREVLEEARRV